MLRSVENEHLNNAYSKGTADMIPIYFEFDHKKALQARTSHSRSGKRIVMEAIVFVVIVLTVSLFAMLSG